MYELNNFKIFNALVKYTAFWDMTPCYTIFNYQITRRPHILEDRSFDTDRSKNRTIHKVGEIFYNSLQAQDETLHCYVLFTHIFTVLDSMCIVVVPQMSSGGKSDVYCCSSTDQFWRKI
jgi:hypothetical protein